MRVVHRNSIRALTNDLVTSPAMDYALLYAIIRRVLWLSGISTDAEAEVLVLRHELAVIRRQVKSPNLRRGNRLFLSAMSRVLPRERWAAFIVTPATLLRWHRELCLVEPDLDLPLVAGDEGWAPGFPRTMGAISLRRGDPAAAHWFEREAYATDRGQPTWLSALALPGLGEALVRLGRASDASAVLHRAVTVARRFGMPEPLAEALAAQAELAASDSEGVG